MSRSRGVPAGVAGSFTAALAGGAGDTVAPASAGGSTGVEVDELEALGALEALEALGGLPQAASEAANRITVREGIIDSPDITRRALPRRSRAQTQPLRARFAGFGPGFEGGFGRPRREGV
jgi:hypothetical protein